MEEQVTKTELPKQEEIPIEQQITNALKNFHINKGKLDRDIVKLSKKNLQRLLHVLMYYPLQDDNIYFNKELQDIYTLTQTMLHDKLFVMQHLNKQAEEKIAKEKLEQNNKEKEINQNG